MDSEDSESTLTPKPAETEESKPKIWHPKAKSAGLGWMERTTYRYLYMYFDIRDFVLQDMKATAEEVDHLVLRRLIPRPLTYPCMSKLQEPPPEGFKRISLRYAMIDNPDALEGNREDIVPALRRIRLRLRALHNVSGPFRQYEVFHEDAFLQRVVLKLDFDLPPRAPSPEQLYEPSIFTQSQSQTTTYDGREQTFDLSDCSSFEGFEGFEGFFGFAMP